MQTWDYQTQRECVCAVWVILLLIPWWRLNDDDWCLQLLHGFVPTYDRRAHRGGRGVRCGICFDDCYFSYDCVEWLARDSAIEHKGSAMILLLLRHDSLLYRLSSTYEEYCDVWAFYAMTLTMDMAVPLRGPQDWYLWLMIFWEALLILRVTDLILSPFIWGLIVT